MTQDNDSVSVAQIPNCKRWSEEERATAIEMAQSGHPYWEIRHRIGRSEDAIGRILRRSGISVGRTNAQRAIAKAKCEDNWDTDAVIGSQKLAMAISAYLERRAA